MISSIKSVVVTLDDIDDTYYNRATGDIICRIDVFSLSPLETLQLSHTGSMLLFLACLFLHAGFM